MVTGIVGGSDLVKQQEQVSDNVVNEVDYSFSENGLVAYKDGVQIHKASIATHLGEENLKEVYLLLSYKSLYHFLIFYRTLYNPPNPFSIQ